MKQAKKVIHLDASEIGMLHCDNKSCDYVDAEPRKWSYSLVGTPCPKCGENLLTDEDHAKVVRMVRLVDWINRWFGPLFGYRRDEIDPAREAQIGIRIHDDTVEIRREHK